MKAKQLLFLITAITLFRAANASAATNLFYWPSEYRAVETDRELMQTELNATINQYREEKHNYDAKSTELNVQIQQLNSQLIALEKRRQDDNARFAERIHKLETRCDILTTNSSALEKKRLEENRKQKVFYDKEIAELQKQFAYEQDAYRNKIEHLRVFLSKYRSAYEARIAQLADQIASLKKISETQETDFDRLSKQANDLENQLQTEIKNGDIKIKREFNKLIVTINERISFDSGSPVLKPNVKPALNKITTILNNYPNTLISIDGHTDNIPLSRGTKFRDNWQLSMERALAVLGYILTEKELDPTRFSAAGFGEFQPQVPNDSDANRANNRRIDIVIVPTTR